MSISPEEQKDLDALQVNLNKTARSAMDALRNMVRADASLLKASGYKTNEEAVVSMYKYYQLQMDQLTRAHTKKWPDK